MAHRLSRTVLLVLVVLLAVGAPRPVLAADATAPEASPADEAAEAAALPEAGSGSGLDVQRAALMAVDVVPVRVGGVFRLLVGSVLMVPVTLLSTLSLPLTRNVGVYRENMELYVLEPFDYTFRRPLGQDF